MTIRQIIGWETGSLLGEPPGGGISASTSAGSVFVGAVFLENSIVRTGNGSLKVVPASGAAGYWEAQVGASASLPAYFRFYVRITVLPSSKRMLWGDNRAGGLIINLNSNGTLELSMVGSATSTSSTALTDTSRWYLIDIKIVSGSQEVKIDGVSEMTTSAAGAANRMRFGAEDTVAATYTAYFDDYARSDTGFIGAGKVNLLLPISDDSRSTEWTGGAGGTTNLWDAVNNIPPTGTATETNLTQIEHAGGATGAYVANMTAYSTIGIAASDVINGVYPFIWTGEDSATGDKLLTFNLSLNPITEAVIAFNVADSVSGALGTWPTGWWVTSGISGGSPSNLTSPKMAVSRPETATRVASVCFMGIYVDYTPASIPSEGSQSDFIPAKSSQIVSVNRASFY